MHDWCLLQQYTREGSQDAFAELVQRHLKFVYGVCLREVREQHLAEDVTQVVFIILARKAHTIREGTVLTGWLFSTARFASRNALKQEARRVRREQKAVEDMVWQTHNRDVNWDNVEPHLHRALASLRQAERNVVLLRCWEGKSMQETATVLGVSEQAARMRLNRALEKLRRYFTKHGFAISGAVLVTLIAERAGLAATPVSQSLALCSALAATSGAGRELISANLLATVQGTIKTMFIAQVKSVALAALSLAMVGVGVGGVWRTTLARAARPPQPPAQRALIAPAGPAPSPLNQVARARPLPRPVTIQRIRHIPLKLEPVLALPVRLAQAASTQPVVSSAPDTVPPTTEFVVAADEIRLDGTLTAVDAEHKLLMMQANAFALASGKATRLNPAKAKSVLVDGKTLIYIRGHKDQPVTLAGLRPNVMAIAIGKDLGSGKPLPAREVAVWDTQHAGDFSLTDYAPQRPDRAAPAPPVAPDVVVAPPVAPDTVAPPVLPPNPVPATNPPPSAVPFDGTFEKVTAAGLVVGWRPFGPNMSIEEEKGNHFLRVTNRNATAAAQAHAFLKLDPAWKLVRVQARMRAHELVIGQQSWEDARVGFSLIDDQGHQVGGAPYATPHLDKDADWTTVQVLCPVPPGATGITLEPGLLRATGTVDFDDIEVIGNPILSTHTITPGFPEGTFEDLDLSGLPVGWIPNLRRSVEVVTEGAAPQPMNHFVRLTNANAATEVYMNAFFKLNPDWQAIQVSARMRAQHLQPGKESWQTARMAFIYVDDFNNQVGGYQLEPSLHADSDWVTLKVKSIVPRGAVYIKLQPYMQNASGIADFDDILVEQDKTSGPPSLPLRPGFPEGKFEELNAAGNPAGWEFGGNQNVHLIKENGNHFLRLSSAKIEQSVSLDARFRLPAGWTALRIRARLRATDLKLGPNPGDHPQLRYFFEDNKGDGVDRTPPPLELKQDSDWITVERETLIPDGVSVIHIVPSVQNSTGIFDIDDIQIEPVNINDN